MLHLWNIFYIFRFTFNVYDDKEPSEETLLKYRFLDLEERNFKTHDTKT